MVASIIDHCAWANLWRTWHPVEKILPACGLLCLTWIVPPRTGSVGILMLTSVAALWGARVPMRIFCGLMAAPAAFVLLSTPFLAFSIGAQPDGFIQFLPEGMGLAIDTTCRALAAISCLVFITLTTPLVDTLLWLRRMGLPPGLIDLIFLTYRLIFVFADRALIGYHAQTARLGYVRFDRGIVSCGLLAGSLLQRAWDQARRLGIGLAARGYEGQLSVLAPEWSLSRTRLSCSMGIVMLYGLCFSPWVRAYTS